MLAEVSPKAKRYAFHSERGAPSSQPPTPSTPLSLLCSAEVPRVSACSSVLGTWVSLWTRKVLDVGAGQARARLLTELFWHWTLELLKRRAGTRWTAPWMLRTHS